MACVHKRAVMMAAIAFWASVTSSDAFDLSSTVWEASAIYAGIDPVYLYSIALVESGRSVNGSVRPWPWALHIDQTSIFPPTRKDAQKQLQAAVAAGKRNIDIGLMQINLQVHGYRVKDPCMLLDPEINLRIAADIAKVALDSSYGDVIKGAGRYHSWSENRARWYGRRVLALYAALKTRGPSHDGHQHTDSPR